MQQQRVDPTTPQRSTTLQQQAMNRTTCNEPNHRQQTLNTLDQTIEPPSTGIRHCACPKRWWRWGVAMLRARLKNRTTPPRSQPAAERMQPRARTRPQGVSAGMILHPAHPVRHLTPSVGGAAGAAVNGTTASHWWVHGATAIGRRVRRPPSGPCHSSRFVTPPS